MNCFGQRAGSAGGRAVWLNDFLVGGSAPRDSTDTLHAEVSSLSKLSRNGNESIEAKAQIASLLTSPISGG
jgi:hypothetical protein